MRTSLEAWVCRRAARASISDSWSGAVESRRPEASLIACRRRWAKRWSLVWARHSAELMESTWRPAASNLDRIA